MAKSTDGNWILAILVFVSINEVLRMFSGMVRSWFRPTGGDYNDFVKALLRRDVEELNGYMNRVALKSICL